MNFCQDMRLFDAISAEDDDRFYYSLSRIENVEDLNVVHHVYTPLGLACNFDRFDFARALLEKGAAVNCRIGDTRQSPVHLAAKGDNKGIKCMQLLKEFGADLNAQDSEGNTPLHHACTMENVVLFDFLMENGASINLINSFEETPLIRAIISQNEYFVKCIVAAGYDVNYPNGDPLEYLIQQQPTMMESINLFISNGADIHSHKHHYLSTAAAHGNIEMMLLLKENGVGDINAVSGILDFTALHYACESTKASHKSVSLLLQWGAGVNEKTLTLDTPLHLACKQCDFQKVLALLKYGANVNARNEKLSTPLTSLLMTRFPGMDELCDFYQIFNILKVARVPLTDADLKLFNRIVPVTLRDLESKQDIFEFLEDIKDYAHQPGKLMDLCRGVIRNCLTPKFSDSIALLPLPVYLKDFLLLKDIHEILLLRSPKIKSYSALKSLF